MQVNQQLLIAKKMTKKNTNVRGSRNILYADYIQGGPKKGL